jgi:hypothetical protein
MNYNLKFVPLFHGSPISGVGMAGNILIVINELLIMNEGDVAWVDMGSYKSICYDNLDYTNNAWEYYFTQNKNFEDGKEILLKPPRPAMINYNHPYTQIDSLIVRSKKLFYDNFKIKDDILDEVNQFFEINLKNKITLGCQIRLGDMVKTHDVPNIDGYWDKILNILEENPQIDQIFLATDDDEAIEFISKKTPIPILYQKNIYRTSSESPYERLNSERENHGYNLCREVLIDMLLLSKCDYFLRSKISAVSLITTILSENIKKIYNK